MGEGSPAAAEEEEGWLGAGAAAGSKLAGPQRRLLADRNWSCGPEAAGAAAAAGPTEPCPVTTSSSLPIGDYFRMLFIGMECAMLLISEICVKLAESQNRHPNGPRRCLQEATVFQHALVCCKPLYAHALPQGPL